MTLIGIYKRPRRRGSWSRLLVTWVAAACATGALAQNISVAPSQTLLADNAMSQITSLLQEKEARTRSQVKLASSLWYALQAIRGQAKEGVELVYTTALDEVAPDSAGLVTVDIEADVSEGLLARIVANGGTLGYVSAAQHAIRAVVPLTSLEDMAADEAIVSVMPAARGTTNVGAVTGQGIISHRAKEVVQAGYTGAGVRVGVVSDSVGITTPKDQLNALIGTGDLPPDTVAIVTVSGSQDGGAATSEGTAMMEIIADMAPGAGLFFATASTSAASFADNIRALRAPPYNCDVIVDDYTYFNEGAFQDGPIARAVNDVVASGALYFSSAANGGNLTAGTAGTWEGDFSQGPASAGPLPAGYVLHLFNDSQAYDTLVTSVNRVSLKWSDPLGSSRNDYDLFVLNASGTAVICASTTVQNGTTDPYEYCGSTNIVAGNASWWQREHRQRHVRCESIRTAARCRSLPSARPMGTTPA